VSGLQAHEGSQDSNESKDHHHNQRVARPRVGEIVRHDEGNADVMSRQEATKMATPLTSPSQGAGEFE
jgi:hypothetical protein